MSKKRSVLFSVIALIIVGGAVYGGYVFGTMSSKNNSGSTNTNNAAKTEKAATDTDQQSANTFHTVVSVGYPYDSSKVVTTRLAVPNRLQSIAINSGNPDPGYTDILANKYNEEMGRWLFGNPDLSGGDNKVGDISLIHIGNDWLQETAAASGSNGYSPLQEYEFTTPAKKSASLAKLESETKECSKSNEKGFTLSGALHVCYSPILINQAVGTYAPFLNFKGYGIVDNQKYVLFGTIRLIDSARYSEDEANKKSNAFHTGNIPDETKRLIAEYVNALKNSTVTSTAQ